jgi:hypothetical protein
VFDPFDIGDDRETLLAEEVVEACHGVFPDCWIDAGEIRLNLVVDPHLFVPLQSLLLVPHRGA